MSADKLLAYVFDEQPNRLTQPLAGWLSASRRFATFVTIFRDKIRKKIRARPDADSLLDLRLELETAYLLLRERSLNLAYEPEQAGLGRSPDFAVTFTTSFTFMAEVTRLRADSQRPAGAPLAERLTDTVCSKLGQLLPQRGNVLIVGVEPPSLTADELSAVMLRLQQRAERNDSEFRQRHRFRDRASFFRHYQRLSEILVRRIPLSPDAPAVAWVNPQAQVPLPARVRTALIRSHTL